MNGHTRNFRVRPEVRQRVIDAANELGYKPNPMVRSIAAKRTNLVAAVGSPNRRGLSTAVHAAAKRLLEENIHVCTAFIRPENGNIGLPSWRVDGVLAVGIEDPGDLGAYKDEGLACVSLNGPTHNGTDSVNIDEHDAVRQAYEHLRQVGRPSVVYIAPKASEGTQRESRAQVQQQEAYIRMCDADGAQPKILELGDDGSDEDALEALRGMESPGALAPNVRTSMRVIQLAAEAGVRVPEDVGLVSLRDEPLGLLTTPALSGVHHEQETMGAMAAELLLERLRAGRESETVPRHERVRGSLMIRGSSAVALRA